jgi:hypothetical protein
MDNEELISKKELLELTNISYGQLYRWKRKGLIPEDWFVRKSSYTGQETFFPRQKVLYRIEKIKNMKDDISLDDLADVFSPSTDNMNMRPEEIIQRNIVSPTVMEMYVNFHGSVETLDFNDILSAYILDKRIVAGDIGMEEGKLLLEVLQAGRIAFEADPTEIFLMRKLGVFICFAVSPPCRICTDNGARLIATVNTASVIEELKCKLI